MATSHQGRPETIPKENRSHNKITATKEQRRSSKRFLGMLTYLAKFITNLSQIAAPLRTLLEKDVEWHWDDEQERSFTELKKLATEAPVLKYFNPTRSTKLSVDANSKGLGAVLLQDGHPIAQKHSQIVSCKSKKKCLPSYLDIPGSMNTFMECQL